ncbi:SIR2 family protein [Clostridium butyricum]|uniref:SIR2 family protein n=1 Tax=Clostridium butyricum TaxID=1492 RepID=UPI0024BAA910|nr:SIR2 family protein [Clostridium butyricum]
MKINEILNYNANNEENFKELIDNIDNVIPFVGAGMSAFSYPTWGEYLRNCINDDLFKEEEKEEIESKINEKDYESAADKISEISGHNFFIKNLTRTYAFEKINEELDKEAVKKLPLIFRKAIITTNFDRVLEKVYQNNPFIHTVYPGQTSLEVSGIQRDVHLLFKIHGDISYTDSIIFTKEQYENNYGRGNIDFTKALPKLLLSIFKSRAMLFLGCSLEEDRTMKVLDSLTNEVTGLMHFAFMQKSSDLDEYRKLNSILDKHNIYPIWYPEGKYECIGVLLDEIIKRQKKN